jgi:hypothetical protein
MTLHVASGKNAACFAGKVRANRSISVGERRDSPLLSILARKKCYDPKLAQLTRRNIQRNENSISEK